MNDESTEQYQRGVVRLYIENAPLEELIYLKKTIEHWINYHKLLNKKAEN